MDCIVWPLALARANPLAHVDIVNRCLFSGPRIHRTHVRLLTSKHFAVDCHRVSPYDPRSIILQATTSVIITHPSTPWSPSYNSQQPLDLCSIQPLLLLMVMITVIIFNISTLATAKEDDIHERIFNRPHEILSRYQEEYYLTTRSDTQPPPPLLVPYRPARFGRTRALSWSSPWRSSQRTSGAYCTLFIDYNRHRPGLITSMTFCITATAPAVTWSAAAVTLRATL